MTKSFNLDHRGAYYYVELEIEGQWEDDSFDHDGGGRRQTEECGHWEIDWDETRISVYEITESTEEEVDVDDVPGLLDAIVDKADGFDLSDLD
jgi:hypothetical protein